MRAVLCRRAAARAVLTRACAVFGRPEDTAWEDGTFKLTLEFTEEYPNKAPTVKYDRSRSPDR